ncbi:MAG: nucleotidyltransferase family protein [Actinomycetes bacterium]
MAPSAAPASAGETTGGLSPETVAVLMCAQVVVGTRHPEDLWAAVAACPSAERLCEEAVRQGMLGHLCRVVGAPGDPVPAGEEARAEAVRERLAQLYRQSAQRALSQTAYLLRILDDLHDAGIDALPMEGPVWAERLYGDVTLRHWDDLDILVHYRQVSAARDRLLAAGFRDWIPWNPRIMRYARRGGGEVALVNAADNALWVDLHWQVGVGYGDATLETEELLARAVPQTLMGRSVPSAAARDLLLMTCLNGMRHGWGSVEMLLAVGVQVRDLQRDAWPALLGAGREAGCERRVAIAVSHTCHALGMVRPEGVDRAIAQDLVSRALLR